MMGCKGCYPQQEVTSEVSQQPCPPPSPPFPFLSKPCLSSLFQYISFLCLGGYLPLYHQGLLSFSIYVMIPSMGDLLARSKSNTANSCLQIPGTRVSSPLEVLQIRFPE
ncbi:unnamed protein product [Rangifer tarandus platyrhynchus]|uniref:Uncharacterized protein n=2 Tax=Rangifer tarandus platyrhynchus TaxID=3082113 RepID=A0ABN8Z4K3_RANTA|nr:unnamed protein product [Rangifer tarandus platyrhynchus]